MKKIRKGDNVTVKLGKRLNWRKGARVVKRRKDNITITGIWGKGVQGTLNKRFVRKSRR